jgi:hypothetical protein
MFKALTSQLTAARTTTYGVASGWRLLPRWNTSKRAISLIFLLLSFTTLVSTTKAAPQCGNPHNAITAFMTGLALGKARVEAKYAGMSATLELGTLKQQLSATDNCLVSLIGEIDGVIEQVRNAPGKQQAINIILEFESVAANRVHDFCGCTLNPSGKMVYEVWKAPYGPGTRCMTAEEAEQLKAEGSNVRPLNQPCQ